MPPKDRGEYVVIQLFDKLKKNIFITAYDIIEKYVIGKILRI